MVADDLLWIMPVTARPNPAPWPRIAESHKIYVQDQKIPPFSNMLDGLSAARRRRPSSVLTLLSALLRYCQAMV